MTQTIACAPSRRRRANAPRSHAPRSGPRQLIADLAAELLDDAEIEAPVNAFVLAHRHGFQLRAWRGPAPEFDADTIAFDATAYWRDRHGEVAAKFARSALLELELDASPRAAVALAKQLLLPPAAFAHDAWRLEFDIEEIGAVHRHAPIEWLHERLRSLARARHKQPAADAR